MYCDTPKEPTGEAKWRKLAARMGQGLKRMKKDIGIDALIWVKDAHSWPPVLLPSDPDDRKDGRDHRLTMHPFSHIRLTQKGIDLLCDYVAQVRSIVGDEVPIAADHFGHIGLDDCIRLGQALERFNLAWLEDLVPWQFTEQWLKLEQALHTPVCTGEDIYLKEGFMPLLQAHAVNVIHPDLATSGGILETKKIGDLAQEHGISMALHMAGSPISTMASVHCAAATENFIALEHHFSDHPFWNDLVDGLPKPLIQNGFIPVPESPGLGFTINEEAIKEHLLPEEPGFFEPTLEWDSERSWDRLWS
jgi:L-alanine-DL-glutamate epimerase-like enolase superfamily enzyme